MPPVARQSFRPLRLAGKLLLTGLLLLGTGVVNVLHAASVGGLRCEYLQDPSGIDNQKPLLSWKLASDRRGEIQSAYQILVATTPELLAAGEGDWWDSGKVTSASSAQIEYAGRPMPSRARSFWKVRVWDREGRASGWSEQASWTMGLLEESDWKAQWISHPVLADPANRPLTPLNCYRSELATSADAAKWIILDLGTSKRMDSVDLVPARPNGISWDFKTVMFPIRFKIEAADQRDFSDARMALDRTDADVPNPRGNSTLQLFTTPVTGRYLRLTVTRLSQWDAGDYGLALAGFSVFDLAKPVAVGAKVECSDSMETARWSSRFLTDGKPAVQHSAPSPALDPGVPDAILKSSVSRVPTLRREFNLPGKLRRATLSVTARGFYEVRVNGRRVGEDLLAPGFTENNNRIQYQTHDVTHLLRDGKNAIGALLGYGWYAGHLNLFEMNSIYGYFPQFMAQIDLELEDGKRASIGTDGQWRTTLEGPVRWSDLLDGEAYDCRREMAGWDQPGFDDRNWKPVWTQPHDGTALVWQQSPPIRVVREMVPVSSREVRPGVHVFDMGQEISGWCRLKVDGPAGTRLRLRHAELVGADGNIDVGTLWGTLQQEDYILDGKGGRTLEPHFTYHGFRYVELTGLPGKPQPDTLVAVNLRTGAATTGRFECSNELFNRIQSAATWTQSNMLFDIPAGCAARSERLGWSGDIRPCVQSLMFNFDTAAFLNKFAADLRDAQTPDGRFTDIAPHAHLRGTTICVGSPGWADAGVSLPWEVYLNTGDKRLLAQSFDSARRWVDVIHASNPDLIWRHNRGQDWGDWLSAGRATPKDIGSTIFFAHSTHLLSRMAGVLGRKEEEARYQALFQGIRQAFVRNYVSPEGIIGGSARKSTMIDVTREVGALIRDGKLRLTAGNALAGGDPALGKVKTLVLTTRVGEEVSKRQFAEGAVVQLEGEAGKPLEIVSASYGFETSDPGDAQGSYAMALQFDMLDEPLRALAAKRMAALVVENGHHPATGFWSSIELLKALSSTGFNADASQMVNQRTEPSWGYMVEHSTTFWESFNAIHIAHSLNHWAHSAVSEWLWRHVAGLNPDERHPGYQAFIVRPMPTKEVTWCKASYDSIRGTIASHWKTEGDRFTLGVTVPANTTATVHVPASSPDLVTESGKPAGQAEGVEFLRQENGAAVFKVGSGEYLFTSNTR